MDDAARASEKRLKTALRRLVGLLAVACFLWVLRPFVAEIGALGQRVALSRLLLALFAAGMLYALAYLLLVEPWRRLLALFGRAVSLRHAWWCYGRSQWAKYLPSNAMHYVGRQLLGRRLGVSHTSLAVTSALEMASMLCAALIVAVIFGRRSGWSEQLPISWQALLALLLLGLVSWPILARLLMSRVTLPAWLEQVLGSPNSGPTLSVIANLRAMTAVLPAHLLFFVMSSGLVAMIYLMAWRPSGAGVQLDTLVLTLLWVVPTSWAAGTLALGAPAGLGVREAIFLLGLQPLLGETDSAGLALAFRCTTVLGDALVAAAAWRLRDPIELASTHDAPDSIDLPKRDPDE